MPINLKEMREKYRINRKYLAEMLGLTESGYYLKEKGKYEFTISEYIKLYKIYKAYDPSITVEYFFLGE